MVALLALHNTGQNPIHALPNFLAESVFLVARKVVEVDLQKQDQLSTLVMDGGLRIWCHSLLARTRVLATS